MVSKHHGMPSDFVSAPRCMARFWQEVFPLLGTQFSMSNADHPQADGQTECVNRVLVDLLKSYAQSFPNWSDYLPMTEFSSNSAVHASTGHTPFFVNAMRHPREHARGGGFLLNCDDTCESESPHTTRRRVTVKNHEQATPASTKDTISVRGTDTSKTHAQAGPVARTSDVSMAGIDTEKYHAQAGPVAITHVVSLPGPDISKSHTQSGTDANTSGGSGTNADKVNELDPGFSSQAMDFVKERQAVVRFVHDAIAASADRQKLNANNVGGVTQMNSKLFHWFCYLLKTCVYMQLPDSEQESLLRASLGRSRWQNGTGVHTRWNFLPT
ncbi:LOW QUALITY PROTEIN: reverse transcriptase [Phytophthora megakarya]|uniref:Reverse transcriptase n=1 Tax=Phytophthora megakarya TaxID=4795 RepID=A0A225UC23_9STRA|nr:LOW QUALITY PROTEIN: reverse transcriptase [Phytophthora megakarya]